MEQILYHSTKKKYTWLPENALQHVAGSSQEHEVLQGVLVELLREFRFEHSTFILPASVRNLYDREIERIKALVEKGDRAALRFDLDVRRKDLAILSFRLIPVGAELAEPWSAIWRRQVLTARFSQFFRAVNYFIMQGHGFWPYFQLHMHQESHEDFHEKGLRKTYMRLAELLDENPTHKGWFSSSWFIDPALEDISPHLSHLRTVPERNGAAIFYMCDDATGETGALAKSRTRRRFFEAGQYVPRIYLRVWPRSSAIQWWSVQKGETGVGRG